jgi:hypothetical protein
LIELIPYRRAISIRNKLNTIGSEPLHVICDDYESYYVKNDRQNSPASSIINEVLCHYFLRFWNINTPDICLINLEEETIKQDYGARHKPAFYSRPAFGSKEQEGAFDFSEFIQVKRKVEFRKYYRPEMFAHIGLFDLWVENEDRPPDLKNLMVFEEDERYHFLAIDHAMAFRTGAYNTLTDKRFWATEEQFMLQSLFFKQLRRFLKRDKGWCRKEQENFYLCISKCKRYFSEIVQLIPLEWGFFDETITILYDYLFDESRNESVYNEYVRMWK